VRLTSRGKFLLLIAVFVVPVIAAWVAYFGWRPAAHSNYGTLLKVTPLVHTTGVSVDGQSFDLAALRGKWVMVRVGGGACDPVCRQQLYLMRQTRIAQGKAQSRIERLWVLEDTVLPDTAVLAEHAGLHVWRPADAGFLSQFPGGGERAAHVYLLDPLGNLMLRFPANPEPKRMMKDLKLLLKASQIG